MTFEHLGQSFQQTLIKSILEDKKYGLQILEVLDSKYFENNSFKYIVTHIKELTEHYKLIPTYVTLKQKIMTETASNPLAGKLHSDTLRVIEESKEPSVGSTYVKETALKFCKQQDLKKTLREVDRIIEKGDFESYDKITEMINTSLQVGTTDDDIIDITENIDISLDVDPRIPIPTGIHGLDNLLEGGIGRGELGMVLAPTGVGKSTILSKMANTACNTGHNVLHIFFEDSTSQIKQKHYTVWSGLSSKNQLLTPENKEFTLSKVREITGSKNFGSLKLAKMLNHSTTIADIRRKILKIESEGPKVDLVVIDYIDCIVADRKGGYDEEWKGEGSVVRQLDALSSDLNVAVWTASQGNRSSISSDIVNIDEMGGSIKKAQTAHIILSIAKSLEQKENKTANMTLVKSRVGADGVNFINCKFDNEMMDIDVTEQETLLGHKMRKEVEGSNRAAEIYKQKNSIS